MQGIAKLIVSQYIANVNGFSNMINDSRFQRIILQNLKISPKYDMINPF